MIDKELEAIYKCHEYLQYLDNEARMRVFEYLLEQHDIKNNKSFESNSINSNPKTQIETVVPEIVKEEKKVDKLSKSTISKGTQKNLNLQVNHIYLLTP